MCGNKAMTNFTPIPQPELDAMQAREEAATEGPWEARDTAKGIEVHPVCDTVKATWKVMREKAQRNVDFMAHARTDQPRLRIALQAAQAEIEKLREGLRACEIDSNCPHDDSCPAWTEGGKWAGKCNCWIAEHNARIDALLPKEGDNAHPQNKL